MRITNYHHIEAPLLPPDDSMAVAAEAEYLSREIDDAIATLNEAKTAAEAEHNTAARALMNRAKFGIECALLPDGEY